ncbi:translation initiation factor IF-2 [Trichloromonas sp.]|uniref:translation initiation factor IF-2 n=1 Tax=Trichloromonas sp. TaxID=3069249 RepID=UPI002A374B3B|nr:translation initiation factor IF-2 [Trichloromonas sp.]
MGKTKVFELAQKLGLELRTVMDRLRKAGVEVKSEKSFLDDDDLRKFEAQDSAQAEVVEEERITSGVIRRRRKDVKPAVEPVAVEVPAPPASVSVETRIETPPVSTKVEEEPASEPSVVLSEKKAEPPVPPAPEIGEMGKKAVVEVAVSPPPVQEVVPPTADVSAEKPKKESVAPVTSPPAAVVSKVVGKMPETKATLTPRPMTESREREPQKASPSRAKILGRVELPVAARPETRGRDAGRPERPATPPGRRPSAPREDRSATGEGGAGRSFGGPTGAPPRSGRGPSIPAPSTEVFPTKEARGGKKNKKGKGADYSDGDFAAGGAKRRQKREVFEPERGDKLRRGRKGAKVVKKTEVTVSKAIKRIIRISDVISVGELAKRMGVKANDLIKELMRQGTMVTINHPLDYETAALLANDFNYEVENVAFDEETVLEHAGTRAGEAELSEGLVARPPVVTIMGHVDHGKTSLLDAIRATNVTEGEAGGITQHIGAYDVELDGKKVAFLDTPGHEAFTAMRARGAKSTDIVVLVVAADDGVMPQTKEAINHAKAAEVPILVAINKIDKPDANPDRVKQELTEFGMLPEEWGGETIYVEVSAKQRTNIDQLLEMILLQAEVMDLKANPNKRAKGVIVEARLDRGRGPVATVLVQEGTLRVGDPIVTGVHFGRVRTMVDDRGGRVEAAGPSCPVEVTGLSGVPEAGDSFHSVEDEKTAKEVAQHRAQKVREAELAKTSKISLEQLYARIKEGDVKELKIIIKGDVQGSVEAVKDSLLKLSTDACRLIVIHTGVGGIIESDITLASASDAIVLGFNVRPEPKAAAMAEAEGVDIRLYNIIYDAVADIRDAMEGLLAPTLREKYLGRAEVRDTFVVSKVGTIAGCYVVDGKIVRGANVRLVRDNVVVWEGRMSSLKRFKDDVREVANNYECGIGLENYNDIKIGDVIEAFEMESVKTSL